MMKRAFWLGIVASALVLVPGAGCDSGKSCQTLCDEANDCENVTEPVEDCAQWCTDRDKLLKAAACTGKQAEYDECRGGLSDVCLAPSQCTTEALALTDCLGDYCTSNPGAEGCP